MSDKKISQLSSASLPLTGNELVPIVQGGSTVKATVNQIVGQFPWVETEEVYLIPNTTARKVGFGDYYSGLDYWATTTISAPNLTNVLYDVYVDNSSGDDWLLDTFSFPSLVSCGNLSIRNTVRLTTLNFDSLTTVTGNTCISGGSNLGAIVITSNNSLTSVSFPALTSISGRNGLIISSNNNLTSIDLPVLSTLINGASIGFSGNPLLTNINIPSLITFDGDFNASGNALTQTCVDNILAQMVTVGLTNRTVTLNGGTNASPTGGVTNADYLTLVANGCTVSIN